VLLHLGLVWLQTNAKIPESIKKITHTLFLGEEKVWVDVYDQPGAEITLFNLHDDENTAAEAGKAFIKKHGGRMIELRHGRGRDVVVRLEGIKYRFDPNRMFSDAGLRASLKHFKNNTDQIFDITTAFRDSVVELVDIKRDEILIIVHNNTQSKMNINDFRPGEWYGEDAKDVSINPGRDPDDFFVVSENDLFASLDLRGYNVALKADNPPDRGMVMDYYENLGVQCISVETEHFKIAEQIAMLEVLWNILSEKEIENITF